MTNILEYLLLYILFWELEADDIEANVLLCVEVRVERDCGMVF